MPTTAPTAGPGLLFFDREGSGQVTGAENDEISSGQVESTVRRFPRTTSEAVPELTHSSRVDKSISHAPIVCPEIFARYNTIDWSLVESPQRN